MSKYHWEEARILDESGWQGKNYNEMETNTGLGLYRVEWREGLARAFMLACGYSFEETFHDDNRRFGEFFDTLLDNAAGDHTINLDDRYSEMLKDFFKKNPESEKIVGKMPEDELRRQAWSQLLLSEMYYAATKEVMQGDYLDIDYLRAYGDDYGSSVENMLRGLYGCASKPMVKYIAEQHPDYGDWHESVYAYLYLNRLEKNPSYKDYLDGKPDAIAPGFLRNGKWVKSAAYDTETPKFDFPTRPDQLVKMDKLEVMFDKVFANFTDNPAVRDEEPIVNRIFIDGKNAYDMFKEKYQGAKNYEEHVKSEIVQAVMTGEKRVELARLDMTRNGTPKATVVPVKADLSGFDKGKKWYEHSVAKKAENLWKNDKERESRIESIKNAVEEKQRAKILSAGYNSTFYKNILSEMNKIRKEFTNTDFNNPEFLGAERKMKQNPEDAQKWMVTKAASLMMNKLAHDLMDFDKNLEDIKNDKEFEKLRSMNLLNTEDGLNSIGTLIDELIDIRKNTDDIIARVERDKAENEKKKDDDPTKRPTEKFERDISETKLGMEDNISSWLSNAGMNMLKEKTDSMVAAKREQGFEVNKFKSLTFNEMDDFFLVNGGIDDDVHKVDAYDAYVQVHDFNVKIMDMMVEKIPDTMSNVKNPESFRNNIRSIRSLLETAGINQEDMKKYGETLTGDAKKTFDSIRKWETEMMKENPKFPIHLPDGITDAKTCVDQMLKMYQNAFYEKCGYVDKLEAESVERVVNQARKIEYTKMPEKEVKNEAAEKKQVPFDVLAKADTTKPQANVRTSNRNAEKSTEKGTRTPMVNDKEPSL